MYFVCTLYMFSVYMYIVYVRFDFVYLVCVSFEFIYFVCVCFYGFECVICFGFLYIVCVFLSLCKLIVYFWVYVLCMSFIFEFMMAIINYFRMPYRGRNFKALFEWGRRRCKQMVENNFLTKALSPGGNVIFSPPLQTENHINCTQGRKKGG